MTKRLLILTHTAGVGGAERFVADLVENLDERGFDVCLAGNEAPALDAYLAERLGRPLPRTTVRLGYYDASMLVQARRVLARRRGHGHTASAGPAQLESLEGPERLAVIKLAVIFGQTMRNYFVLRRLLKRLSPEILLINNGGYPGSRACQVAAIAAKAAGVSRVVSFVHHYAVAPDPAAPRLELSLDRRVDAATDVWVTPGRGAAERLASVRAVPRDRIAVVYLGQATSPAATPNERADVLSELGIPDTTVVLFVVAGLIPIKGHTHALAALELLRQEGCDVHMVVVGDGPGREDVRTETKRRALEGHVTLLGFRHDVQRLMSGCDILMHPALKELLPYVLKEAMARGLPCVATDVGDTRELVEDGVTGLLVPPADPAALAQAVRTLAEDAQLRRRLGEAGRDRLRRDHSLEGMVGDLEQLLTGLSS